MRRRTLLTVLVAILAAGCAAAPKDSTLEPPPPRKHSVFPIPVVFYTPETRWAGGAAAIHTFRPDSAGRPAISAGSFVLTQNRQVAAELNTDAYLADGRYAVAGGVSFSHFPETFYGIGNDARAEDRETYTSRSSRFALDVRRKVRPGLFLGASYELRNTDILAAEEGGLLATGAVVGSDGGLFSGAGLSFAWDTRDNVVSPSGGSYHTATLVRGGGLLGGGYEMTRVTTTLRHYRSLSPGHVLGFHAQTRSVSGDVPFDMLPRLGGQNIMRGTFGSRFRDHHLAAAQAEYRATVWRRLGAVVFAGAGQVAPSLGDMALADLHYSVGYGLRFMIDPRERMNLRVDFGYGRDGSTGLYITVSEAF
jgi:outer membrane protein assembly factor BamA